MPSRSMFDSSFPGMEPLCILALRMCLWVIAVQSPTDESNLRDPRSGQEAAVPFALYSLLIGAYPPPLALPLIAQKPQTRKPAFNFQRAPRSAPGTGAHRQG